MNYHELIDGLWAALDRYRAEEREACAKVVEDYADLFLNERCVYAPLMDAARMIRERGNI